MHILAGLKYLWLGHPSHRHEQTAIVEYLQTTADIDAAARRQIELLREYRTRLIADVVTGLDLSGSASFGGYVGSSNG